MHLGMIFDSLFHNPNGVHVAAVGDFVILRDR
jgi:hypothetical protein